MVRGEKEEKEIAKIRGERRRKKLPNLKVWGCKGEGNCQT